MRRLCQLTKDCPKFAHKKYATSLLLFTMLYGLHILCWIPRRSSIYLSMTRSRHGGTTSFINSDATLNGCSPEIPNSRHFPHTVQMTNRLMCSHSETNDHHFVRLKWVFPP